MIKSFRHKGLERLFLKGEVKGINPSHAKRLRLVLRLLDSAKDIQDMNYSGSRLHKLKGDMQNLWSVTVTGNYRITFEFIDGDAYIVDYQDYH